MDSPLVPCLIVWPVGRDPREVERGYGRAMTRYVVDAPTVVTLVAEGVRINPAHQLVAPGAIRSQALALLFDAVRRGELVEREALEQHERLTGLKMRLLNDRVSRRTAWRIARDQGWTSTQDAEYVALARLQADALVTVDPRLAAKADGLVPLAPLSSLTIGTPRQ